MKMKRRTADFMVKTMSDRKNTQNNIKERYGVEGTEYCESRQLNRRGFISSGEL